MKLYTTTAVSNFLMRPHINSSHANMFHGLAERGGKEMPHDQTMWANTESPSPLLISRTIHGVPEISKPSTHLVVSERLADKLRQFNNIRLAPAVFKRLVDVEYHKWDMSWAERWPHTDPRTLLRELPDVTAFRGRIGHYFEVQTWRMRDIVDQYPLARELSIEVLTPPLQETEILTVSAEMLNDYPMLWWSSVILNEDAFALLDDSLDRDFFVVREYESD